MDVDLIKYDKEALDILIFTKNTRLSQDMAGYAEVQSWPEEKKLEELAYMLDTIQSSWEFCDYTFAVSGVSRAFTHQFVRSRHGSFAQQSQRTVDMEGFGYITPGTMVDAEAAANFDDDFHLQHTYAEQDGDSFIKHKASHAYHQAMVKIDEAYEEMRELDVAPQDARGILPTNVETNIIAKFSLRTLADMAKLRLCTRTQGEYQDVFRLMRDRVIEVHPWAEPFIRVYCASTGVCCFPRYEECPIKPGIFNPDTGKAWPDGASTQRTPSTKTEIQQRWETTRFEATPWQK
jgi:flavin-dependent thymidylate synthase